MPTFGKFSEYQERAMGTAFDSAKNVDYALNGLVAEVGELFGVCAKNKRDNWSEEEFVTNATKEAGDVMWFVALIVELENIDFNNAYAEVVAAETHGDSKREDADMGNILAEMMKSGMTLFNGFVVNDDITTSKIKDELLYICRLVSMIAVNFCGTTIDEVMKKNIDKLYSRKARGVISGSGDNR